MSDDNRFYIALGVDVITNIVVTTAQLGDPKITVVAPFIAGDMLYTGAVKEYVDNNFGGQGGLADQFARDVIGKTLTTAGTIWLTSLFTNTGVGVLEATLNALVTYTASDGVQNLIDL